MNSIIYKRLLEVRIIHDYYLMKAFMENSTTSFFTASNQSDILEKVLKLGQYNNADFFEIQPFESTKKTLKQYNIRLIHNQLGFFLGMEVKKTKTPSGPVAATITYQPKTLPSGKVQLLFTIKSTDPFLNKRAILPSSSTLNAKYYFTNKNDLNNKAFPVLSEGNNGLVNQEDLKFLPFKISVETTPGKNIKARLAKPDGTIIINKEKLATENRVLLNLKQHNTYTSNTPPIPDGLYKLKIHEDGNLIKQDTYFFSDLYYRESNFGILDFSFDAQQVDYNLLQNQTDLKAKIDIDANGLKTPTKHPVFELRLEGNF